MTGRPPGVRRGRDEVINGIGKVFVAIRLTGADLETLVVDGDRVVGLLTAKANGGRPATLREDLLACYL